jgi:uncharacterized protein YxeA
MKKILINRLGLFIFIILCTLTAFVILSNCQEQLSIISKHNNYVYGANIKQSDSKSNIAKNSTLSTRSYTGQIKAGNFIAGTDFPSGTYTFLVVEGNGEIMSSETSTVYSVGTNSDAQWGDKLSDIVVSENSVITVKGDLILYITSSNASDQPLDKRTEHIDEGLTLNSGGYIAGEDFDSGTYSIYAINGYGFISSDNSNNISDCGIAVWMNGVNSNDYCNQYSNVELDSGVSLNIDEGLEVTLVPVY